jgi:hypothetical protein
MTSCDDCAIYMLNIVPVILLVGFIAVVYYCYVYTVFVSNSPDAVLITLAIILHIFLILSLICYFRCVFAKKSRIPENFHIDSIPDSEKEPLKDEYIELDHATAKVTYCNRCQKYRPARAHHCSICKVCILRYDHHCPWIGNCVGFHNHKYFILFLTYMAITSIMVAASCCYCLRMKFEMWQAQMGAAIGFAGFLGVGGFAVFHYWMLGQNCTSIELRFQGFNVFNTGDCKENASSLCGDSVCIWCLPMNSSRGEGVLYPVRLRTKQGNQVLIYNRYLI